MLRFAVLSLFFCVSMLAQNAVVSGRISDAQDAVIAGASITISNRSTGLNISATTNGEGYYVTPPLPPGIYDVSISSPGFSPTKLEAVTLEVDRKSVV